MKNKDKYSSGLPILNISKNKVIGIYSQSYKEKNYNISHLLNYPIKEYLNNINLVQKQKHNPNDIFEKGNNYQIDYDSKTINFGNIEKEKKVIKKIERIEIKNKNDNLYKDFNIQSKELICKLNFQTYIYCLTVLNDGRLVSGSGCDDDKSIIIYNKRTYQPDLIIKEHNQSIMFLTQLSSGELVSCSHAEIKIYKIKGVEYEILQTFKSFQYHTDWVYKIIELKNKHLVSCSRDSSIIFYYKDNFEYKKDYRKQTKGLCSSVIMTKENEIYLFFQLFRKEN